MTDASEPFACPNCGEVLYYKELRQFVQEHWVEADTGEVHYDRQPPQLLGDTDVIEDYVECSGCGRKWVTHYEFRDGKPPRLVKVDPATGRALK